MNVTAGEVKYSCDALELQHNPEMPQLNKNLVLVAVQKVQLPQHAHIAEVTLHKVFTGYSRLGHCWGAPFSLFIIQP